MAEESAGTVIDWLSVALGLPVQMNRAPVPPTLPDAVPPSLQPLWPLEKSPFVTRFDVTVSTEITTGAEGPEFRSMTVSGTTVIPTLSVSETPFESVLTTVSESLPT